MRCRKGRRALTGAVSLSERRGCTLPLLAVSLLLASLVTRAEAFSLPSGSAADQEQSVASQDAGQEQAAAPSSAVEQRQPGRALAAGQSCDSGCSDCIEGVRATV